MLTSLLPGLRELRAPLAAGYLWLLLAWLALGDELPTSAEAKADALDRAYRLEPVLSQLGLVVVVSVVAYVLGSIVIDAQTQIARIAAAEAQPAGIQVRSDLAFLRREKRRLVLMPILAGVGCFAIAAWMLPESTAAKIVAVAVAIAYGWFNLYWTADTREYGPTWVNHFRNRFRLDRDAEIVTQQGWKELVGWLSDVLDADIAVGGYGGGPALNYITRNRNLIKTRLLADSEALHSEVDRLDAEANFRMAIWPPLAGLSVYLAVAVSPLWLVGLVVPAMLAWQWGSLRKQANDALVTALVARPTLSEPVAQYVREEAIKRIALDKADSDGKVIGLTIDVDGQPFRHEVVVMTEEGSSVTIRLDARMNVLPDEPRSE